MSESNQGASAPQADAAPAEANLESSENESLDAQEGAQEASDEAAKSLTPAQKKYVRSLKLKVDGEEFDEELPFEIEDSPEQIEYFTKQLQMARVGQKRMGEKAQLEKEVKRFFDVLKKDPKRALSDPNIGIDVKQLAKDIIEEEIANSQKSPEQLEAEKLKAELKALREEQEKSKEEAKLREKEKLEQREFERYDDLMTKALEKSDLPKSPYVVKRMADVMLEALTHNIDIAPADVLDVVREEIVNDIKDMFGAMPEEVVEAIIGKDVFTKIRKKNLAKAKAKAPVHASQAGKDIGADKGAKPAKEEKKQSYKDFFGV